METYVEMEVQLHAFLTSSLDGGEWWVSHSSRFTSRRQYPNAHWIADQEGAKSGLNAVAKRKKKSMPLPRIEPRSSDTDG
jgi:hypothetical protein